MHGGSRTAPASSIVVLHVAESFSSGVASAIEAYLEAAPAEVEAYVVGYRVPGAQIEQDVDLRVPFIELPPGKVRQIRDIRRAIRDVQPDVLHLHSSWAGVLGRVLSVPRSTTVVYTPHCSGFERTDLSSAQRFGVLAVERVLGRRTDVLVACGEHEAAVARRYRLGREVLHLPQQLPKHLRDRIAELRMPARDEARPLVVAMSGRVCAQKGPEWFAAVARALRSTPERRAAVQLRWIGSSGPGDAELRASGVETTGWISQRESIKELATCDVYLHTAAWEGFPMTVLEAQQLGLPVVARNIESLAAQPAGITLVDDPREAAAALLDLAERWPVIPPVVVQPTLEARRAVLRRAYGLDD